MYMYVNKRVELAQRGIAVWKMYVFFIIIITYSPASLMHTFSRSDNSDMYCSN